MLPDTRSHGCHRYNKRARLYYFFLFFCFNTHVIIVNSPRGNVHAIICRSWPSLVLLYTIYFGQVIYIRKMYIYIIIFTPLLQKLNFDKCFEIHIFLYSIANETYSSLTVCIEDKRVYDFFFPFTEFTCSPHVFFSSSLRMGDCI